MKTGHVNLPLHNGACPRWLFPSMVRLSKAVSEALIDEFGQEEFLKRLADPYWFHALGCVIGFDWNSSGLSTTTLGALKEALNKENFGIYVAGGKGKASKKTLQEIENTSFSLSTYKIEKLKYASRMSAKVDNVLLQDSYQLYHHSFVFDEKGDWAVIQQGMNDANGYARRYHWISDNIIKFVEEPHNAICCDNKNNSTLDMTSKQNEEVRRASLEMIKDNPEHLKKYFNKDLIKNKIIKINNKNFIQKTINEFNENKIEEFTLPRRHIIIDMRKRDVETLKKAELFWRTKNFQRKFFSVLGKAHEIQPQNYEELVAIKGVGAKTIRSLALISNLIYGSKISWRDPVKFSFAHGGKDNIPYPVDKKLMDDNAILLKNAIKDAKLGNKDKINAIRRLRNFYQ